METSCDYCGRELENESCSCLHTNPLKKIEVVFIMILLLVLPAFFYSFLSYETPVFELDYLLIGSIILSGVLILLTMLELIFKRPYLALLFGCHQIVSRTIKLFKNPLPLCARCTGIYLGVIISVFVFYISDLGLIISIALGIPLIIDGTLQKKMGLKSNNKRRFITGLLFGFAFVGLYSAYNASMVYLIKLVLPI